MSLKELKANPRNPRLPFTEKQKEAFHKSIVEFGDLSGVILNSRTHQLVGGHKRREDFENDPLAKVVIKERLKKPDRVGTIAWGYVLTNGTRYTYRVVDWPKLNAEEARRSLMERFGVPPFSVLDARQGYWQERKRAWIALGIKSELGRGGGLAENVGNHSRTRSGKARGQAKLTPGGRGKNSAWK